MSQGIKYGVIWVFLFLSLVMVWTSMKTNAPSMPEEVRYSEFKEMVTSGKIVEVTIPQDGKIRGRRENAADVYAWLPAVSDDSLTDFLQKFL